MKRIIQAAGLAALLAAAPAAADQGDFYACDGFKAPDGTIDGTQSSSWGGMFAVKAVPPEPDTLRAAVASCTTALADPVLKPDYQFRRYLLLRAKAVYLIALKDGAEAGAALDQADALLDRMGARVPSPDYRDSDAELRIAVEYLAGNADAARTKAAALQQAHPYSARVNQALQTMRVLFDPDPAALRHAMLARVPTDPVLLNELFWLALYYEDYPEALRLAPQVSFELPRGRGDSHISGMKDHQYDVIENRAEQAGAVAYALVAAGQGDASQAALAKAHKDIADASQVPTPAADDRAAVTDRDLRVYAAQNATGKLGRWEAAIALRGQAPGMTLETFVTAMKEKDLRDLPIMIDLLGQLKLKAPGDQLELRRIVEMLRQRRDDEMHELEKFDLNMLADGLPRPGARAWPSFRAAGDGFIFGDSNGFYSKQESRSPYLNVRYGDDSAPKWAVEDLTLLAAATYARKAKKDSFLIDSRMLVNRTIRMLDYRGQTTSTQSNGVELRLRILPVNAAELPANLESSRWRLIPVQAVINELGPTYAPAVPTAKH